MVTKELIEYIKKCREQNISDEQIKNTLKEQGWQENDISEVFKQKIQSVGPQQPKKKTLVPVIIIVVVLLFGAGVFLGYKYLIKNKLGINKGQTDILAGFDLSNVAMSKDSLTRSVPLEQLGIPEPTEDGDGVLILKELNEQEKDWSDNPSDAKKKEIISQIPDKINKIAKQKNFSQFSKIYNYPQTLDALITQEGWVLIYFSSDIRNLIYGIGAALGVKGEFIDIFIKSGPFWEVASSLSNESAENLLKNYIVVGNKILVSNDRDCFLLINGFNLERMATEVLAKHYAKIGDSEKAELYNRYLSEILNKRKNFSDRFNINTKLTVYGLEVFSFAKTFGVDAIREKGGFVGVVEIKNDTEAKNLFKEVADFGELCLQEQALKHLLIFWAIPEAKLEHALTEEVLRFYSEKSDNKYIRDMASEILNTNPEDLYNKLLNLIEPHTEEDIEE